MINGLDVLRDPNKVSMKKKREEEEEESEGEGLYTSDAVARASCHVWSALVPLPGTPVLRACLSGFSAVSAASWVPSRICRGVVRPQKQLAQRVTAVDTARESSKGHPKAHGAPSERRDKG